MCPRLLSRLLVRLVAFVFVCVGVFSLLLNVLQSYRDFNPTYWLYYIERQFAGPLLLLAGGALLFLFSGVFSRLLLGRRADAEAEAQDACAKRPLPKNATPASAASLTGAATPNAVAGNEPDKGE